MTLPVPDLDDRTYDDLVAEAQSLIPAYAPEWTNYNPSDPGITLLELFAWLTEQLVYQVNQVPDSHVEVFLKLLDGTGPSSGRPLDTRVRETLVQLRRRHRAVTAADYEALAREASPQVARAHCVPRRFLGADADQSRTVERPDHMSVVVVPHDFRDPRSTQDVVRAVASLLEGRRLLAVRNSVVLPVWAPVGIELILARDPSTGEETIRKAVTTALNAFFDPLHGGFDGSGWPFGRSVYISDLDELIEAVPGVDYVSDLQLSSTYDTSAPGECVTATDVWSESGDQVGLQLAEHHLPWLGADSLQIVSSADMVHVELAVAVKPLTDDATANQAVKRAARAIFAPGDPPVTLPVPAGWQPLDPRRFTPGLDVSAGATLTQQQLEDGIGYRLNGVVDQQVTVILGPPFETGELSLAADELADLHVYVEISLTP